MFSTRNVSEHSKSVILSRVPEFDLFRFYCPSFAQLNKKFSSELRTDNDPSCSITQMPSGRLIYRDHTEGITFTIFQYVQRKFFCTEEEALNIISADFNLTNLKPVLTPSLNYVGLPDPLLKNKENVLTPIPIKRREWLPSDTYWDQYHIPREILNLYRVVPISAMWTQVQASLYQTYWFKPEDPAYSYEHGNSMRKVLRPNTSRDKKWRSNIPRHIYSGWDQLDPQGDVLIITKALKDVMIWRMAGFNAISPQGESIRPTEGFINLLLSRYPRILVNYDNDAAGIRNMNEITEQFGLEGFVMPQEKDPSDFVKVHGFDSLIFKQLIYNGIT